jgi:hypothetical protein
LQLLVPGEVAVPGSSTGKSGTPNNQTAGTAFTVTVNSVDSNWNKVTTSNPTVSITTSDLYDSEPANAQLVNGTSTFNVTPKTAGILTITASDVGGVLTSNVSPDITVGVGAAVKLQLLVPGESAVPGSSTGKTGTPNSETAGVAFTVTVNCVDSNWNKVSTANPTVKITTSDLYDSEPDQSALVNGTQTYNVTLQTAGSATITASDVGGVYTSNVSPSITVQVNTATKLQLLLPGEVAVAGKLTSPAGKSGTPNSETAGVAFTVTVNCVDNWYNIVSNANPEVKITTSDLYDSEPDSAPLVNGSKTYSVTLQTAGSATITASDVDGISPLYTESVSPSVTVNVNTAVKLQVLVPGETAAPGKTSSPAGKIGTPSNQVAGTAFNVTVNCVDDWWNIVSSANPQVTITTSDLYDTEPPASVLVNGTKTFSVNLVTVGSTTITASDTDGIDPLYTSNVSPTIAVNPGTAVKLQLLVPGEVAVPGSATGKTGTPSARVTGVAFNVTVNCTDANWNIVSTANPQVGITTSDLYDTEPSAAFLASGTKTFSVTLVTAGSTTITASDVDGVDPLYTESVSPTITVNTNTATKLQLLVPGEVAVPGSASGKTGTPNSETAGVAFPVTVNCVDNWYNKVSSANPVVGITTSDPYDTHPGNITLVNGTGTSNVTFVTGGSSDITVSDVDGIPPLYSADVSPAISVNPGTAVKLQLLVPGESAVPGSSTGKTGTPSNETAGVAFTVTVNCVDANWNTNTGANPTVKITTSDLYDSEPDQSVLVNGTQTYNVTLQTAGSATITASDVGGVYTSNVSPSITVQVNTATKLQLLLPGEVAVAGKLTSPAGKTGTPNAQVAGSAFTVTVNCTDNWYNIVSSANPVVKITTSDEFDTEPTSLTLVNGTQLFSVTLKTGGSNHTITASDVDGIPPLYAPDTSPTFTVNPAVATKLQLLVPGEVAVPGSSTGKSGTPSNQTSGTAFTVTVNCVDPYWNLVTSANPQVTITTSDLYDTEPSPASLFNGTKTFSVTLVTAGSSTLTATDTDGTPPLYTANVSPSITVNPGTAVKLQLLVPGEVAVPGSSTGKSGTTSNQTSGTAFNVTVNCTDSNWNRVTTANPEVKINTSDLYDNEPLSATLSSGTQIFSVTLVTAGSATLTASDVDGVDPLYTSNTSSSITVNPGTAVKLQLLVPGEVAVPGSSTGKSGTPSNQTSGTAFNVTVNCTDDYWNKVTTANPQVTITTSDLYDTEPTPAALSSGTRTFSVTLVTGGTSTITATDTDGIDPLYTSNISSSITVNPGTPTKLIVLLPGESLVPGSSTGKTGTPIDQTAAVPFNVTTYATDNYWNIVTSGTEREVSITTSDPNDTHPTPLTLANGTAVFNVNMITIGEQTVTATDTSTIIPAYNSYTSSVVNMKPGPAVKLQLLVPGETASPGSPSGKTGTPSNEVAGVAFTVTVNCVDSNWNTNPNDNPIVTITTSDPYDTEPAPSGLINGTKTFSVTLKTAGTTTITATDTDGQAPLYTANISPNINVIPNNATKLQLLVPGEVAVPGSSTGKSGTPSNQTAGTAFTVTVNCTDDYWNKVSTANPQVSIYTSDLYDTEPTPANLVSGSLTFNVTPVTASPITITAKDTDGIPPLYTQSVSPSITVNPGPAVKLQLLLPGEVAAPGSSSGKTGTPSNQIAGTAFNVTVNCTDSNWNIVTTANPQVTITTTDNHPAVVMPSPQNLTNGTRPFSVTLATAGTINTLTASDTDGISPLYTSYTSPNVPVYPASISHFSLTGIAVTTTLSSAIDSSTTTIPVADTTNFPSSGEIAIDNEVISYTGKTANSFTGATRGASYTIAAAHNANSYVSIPITAGTSANLTVEALDQYNNRCSAGPNQYLGTVAFSTTDTQATVPANYTFTSGDAGIKTITGSLTMKTRGVHSVTVRDILDNNITGTEEGVIVKPASAYKFVVKVNNLTSDQNITAGSTPSVKAQITDAFNNTIAQSGVLCSLSVTDVIGTSGTLSSTSATTDSTGQIGISPTITYAVSTHAPDKATITVSADSPAITGKSGILTTIGAAADHLAFLAKPTSVTAGNWTTVYTIQRYDVYNNVTELGNTLVNLSSNSTGTNKKFSSTDPVGTGPTIVTTVTIPAGSSTVNFWYYDEKASYAPPAGSSPWVITCGGGGLTPLNGNLVVNPSTIAKLAIITPSRTLTAGTPGTAPNNVITVQTQDTFGNAQIVTSDTVCTLSSNSIGTHSFSLSDTTWVSTTTLTIAANTNSKDFYYKDEKVGGILSLDINASDTTITVVSTDGFADGSEPDPLKRTIKIGSEQIIYTGKTATTFTGCTRGANNTTPSPHYIGDVVYRYPAVQITVDETPSVGWQAATQVETIVPDAIARLSFSTPSYTVTAGSASSTLISAIDSTTDTIPLVSAKYFKDSGLIIIENEKIIYTGKSGNNLTGAIRGALGTTPTSHNVNTPVSQLARMIVQSSDQYGNPAPVSSNTNLGLTSTSVGASFSLDGSNWTATTTTILSGNSVAEFYYKDTKVGTPTVTVYETPSQAWIDAGQSQTVTPNAISKIVFISPPQKIVASDAVGAGSSLITIQTQDAYGNPSNVESTTTILLSSSSPSGQYSSDGGLTWGVNSVTITAGTNIATFKYRDTIAGNNMMTAVEAPSKEWVDGTQNIIVTNNVANYLEVTHEGFGSVRTPIVITVKAKDQYGNLCTGDPDNGNYYTGTVNFSSTGSGTCNPNSHTFTTAEGGVTTFQVTDQIVETIQLYAEDSVNSSIAGTSPPLTLQGMTVSPISQLPGGVPQNTSNQGVVRLDLKTNSGITYWSAIRIDRLGTALDSDVPTVKVYRDDNGGAGGDGALDPTRDTLIGTGTFSSGIANISFTSSETISTNLKMYFITFDVTPTAEPTRFFGLELSNLSYFTISGILVAANNFPIITTTLSASITPTSTVITANSTNNFPASGIIAIDNELISYTGKTSTTFIGLTRGMYGTVPANHTTGAKIYIASSITAKPAEVTVTPTDIATIPLASNMSTSSTTLTVPYRISTTLTSNIDATTNTIPVSSVSGFYPVLPPNAEGVNYGILIDDEIITYTSIDGTNFMNCVRGAYSTIPSAHSAGTPVYRYPATDGWASSGIIKIDNEIITYNGKSATTFNNLTRGYKGTTPANHTAGTTIYQYVEQGMPNVPIEKVVLNTDMFNANWTAIRIDSNGTSVDTDISGLRIYKDFNNNGSLEPAIDILINAGTETFETGTKTVILTTPETISPTPKTYFIVYSVANGATIGNTIGGLFGTKDYFMVTSPNTVRPTNFPFQSGTPYIHATVDTLTVSPEHMAPAAVIQGDKEVAMTRLGVVVDAHSAFWTSVKLDRNGTGSDSDISAIKIYKYQTSAVDALGKPIHAVTKLTNAIDSSTTTITVASTKGPDNTEGTSDDFPLSGYIYIENEKISYTGRTATTFTGCTRGVGGTTPSAHSAEKIVTGDLLVSSGADTFSGGTSTIVFLTPQEIFTSPSYYFVVYDFSYLATVGTGKQGVSIVNNSYFTLSGVDVVSNANFPFVGISINVNEYADTVTVSGTSEVPTSSAGPYTIIQGTPDVSIEKLIITTDKSTAYLSSIKVDMHPSATASDSDISAIKIVRDNGNGIYEPGIDTLISRGTTLSSDINSTAVTIPVVSTNGFPSTGSLKIEDEIVTYSGITPTSFTGVTRGAAGTNPVPHRSGKFVTDAYFANKTVNINLVSPELITTSIQRYFVVLNISDSSIPERTVGVKILDNSYLTISSPNVVSNANMPVESALSTIKPTPRVVGIQSFVDCTSPTLLSSDIDSATTSITINSTSSFPTPTPTQGTYAIQIDSEIITYTGKTDTVLTGCTRGAFGTTPASHNSGTPVYRYLFQGDKDIAMGTVTLTIDGFQAEWTEIDVVKGGNCDNSDIAKVKIYRDDNGGVGGNGKFDPAVDTLMGWGTFSGGQSNIIFSTPEKIVYPNAQLYFIVYDIADGATPGKTVGMQLLTEGALKVSSPNTVASTYFPITTGTPTINPTIDTLTLTKVNKAPVTITQGQGNQPYGYTGVLKDPVAMLRVDMKADAHNVIVNRIKVKRTGTGSDSDITAVRIYYDANGNGEFDPYVCKLNGTIVPTDTVIPVDSTSGFPDSGTIWLGIEGVTPLEAVTYTSKSATEFLGCTRGAFGTTPGSYSGVYIRIDPLISYSTDTFIAGEKDLLLAYPQNIGTTSKSYFIVYTLANLATVNKTVGVEITDNTCITLEGTADRVSVANFPLRSTESTIIEYGDVVTIEEVKTAENNTYTYPENPLQGQNVAVMRLKLYTNIADALWTGIAVSRTGTSNDDDVVAVKIYRSANDTFEDTLDTLVSNNAILSAPLTPTDTVVKVNPVVGFANSGKIKIDREKISYTGVTTDANGRIIEFTGLTRTNPAYHPIGSFVTDGFFGKNSVGIAEVSLAGNPQKITTTATTYFIVCQIDPGATTNATLGVSLSSPGVFTLSTGNTPSGTFPLSTNPLVTIAEVKNNLTYSFIGPLGAKQNQVDVPVEKFTLSTNNPIATSIFSGMRLRIEGTAPTDPSAITVIKIYKDRNLDGSFKTTDDSPAIGEVRYGPDFNSGGATITFSTPETITSNGTTFFIVVDIGDAPNAIPGTTVQIKFEVTGDQSHPSFLMITPGNFASPSIGTVVSANAIEIKDKRTPSNPTVNIPDWINTTSSISGNIAFAPTDVVTDVQYTISLIEPKPENADQMTWYSVGLATTLQIVDLNLDPDKTYYVGVRTINRIGTQEYISDPTSKAVKIDLTPPSAPTDIKTTVEMAESNVAAPSYTVIWTIARDLESGVVDYELQEREDTPENVSPVWKTVSTQIKVEGNKAKAQIYNKPRGHIYYYRTRARNAAGTWGPWSEPSKGIAIQEIPKEVISAVSNYPNPFDSRKENTIITYILNQDADVTITIYDLLGHLVRTIECPKGTEGGKMFANSVTWDGKNDIGDEVARGGYICRIVVKSNEGIKQAIRKIGVLH